MANLTELKETPDFALKNITKDIELSDTELFKELDGQKESAFNFLKDQELNNMNAEDKAFNNAGKINNSNPDKVQIGSGQNKVNLGSFIDSELATKMLDTLIPSLCVLALRMGGISANKKEIQATPRELEAMRPLVQKCMETIELNIDNPIVALSIVAGTVYATKTAEIGFNRYMDKKEGKEHKESRVNNDNDYSYEKKPRKPRSDKGQRRV